MKRISAISMWLIAGFLIATWLGPDEFGLGSRNVRAAESFEVDRQQILDLISRYSYDWDGKDADAFTALFQDNATQSTYSAGKLTRTVRSNKERLARAHEQFQSFTAQASRLATTRRIRFWRGCQTGRSVATHFFKLCGNMPEIRRRSWFTRERSTISSLKRHRVGSSRVASSTLTTSELCSLLWLTPAVFFRAAEYISFSILQAFRDVGLPRGIC